MSRTLIYAGRIAPRAHRMECYECGGTGTIERITGTIYTASAILPREVTEECPECRGAGLNPCCYCGEREPVEICSDGPVCAECALGGAA